MRTNMFYVVALLLISKTSCSQTNSEKPAGDRFVGGSCEGCEAVMAYGNRTLDATDTLADFTEAGPKLKVTGTIYQRDGQTPANGIVLYVYHTNQQGLYASDSNAQGWGKRHGALHGWIKTGTDGRYTFYTLRPAPYPGRNIPAHIHPLIKEPGLSPYFIDEYLFDDDALLSEKERQQQEKRGGNGVIKLTHENGMLVMKRDIILGLHIPGY